MPEQTGSAGAGADSDAAVVVGLMSGTSVDGIDACVARLEIEAAACGCGCGGDAPKPTLRHEILACKTYPWPAPLRRAILAAATVEDVCRLNFAAAEAFAAAALRAIKAAKVLPGDVLAIGSHGQTLFHAPGARPIGGRKSRSTLQIGDISAIAARTGIVTVGDFRTKDIALGGQGAPLVPFVEFLLTPSENSFVWLNIGGIANITFVPQHAAAEDVTAFDTGPGNTLIDRVVRARTNGKTKFDRGGALARRGAVDEKWLTGAMDYPYFRRKPPKSTGPEEFGESFLKKHPLPRKLEDACATLAAFTADTIAAGIRAAVRGKVAAGGGAAAAGPERIIASGGGIENRAIMARLAGHFPKAAIVDSNFVGVPPDAKEAFAFAVLGYATLLGVPNNLPSATGAAGPAVLGKIAIP